MAVFEDFDPSLQSELIAEWREDAGDLILTLDPDDRAGVLGQLPASVARRLLTGLDVDERTKTTALLGYPHGSVGRRMTPNVVALPTGLSVEEALTGYSNRSRVPRPSIRWPWSIPPDDSSESSHCGAY